MQKIPTKCHSESASAGEESLDFIDVTAFKRSFADAQDDKLSSWITYCNSLLDGDATGITKPLL